MGFRDMVRMGREGGTREVKEQHSWPKRRGEGKGGGEEREGDVHSRGEGGLGVQCRRGPVRKRSR
jgi:hypothetical protein